MTQEIFTVIVHVAMTVRADSALEAQDKAAETLIDALPGTLFSVNGVSVDVARAEDAIDNTSQVEKLGLLVADAFELDPKT